MKRVEVVNNELTEEQRERALRKQKSYGVSIEDRVEILEDLVKEIKNTIGEMRGVHERS